MKEGRKNENSKKAKTNSGSFPSSCNSGNLQNRGFKVNKVIKNNFKRNK
jgi:hypothetical protein